MGYPDEVIHLERVRGQTRMIFMTLTTQSERLVVELLRDGAVIATEEFSLSVERLVTYLFLDLHRLREGNSGTLPEFADLIRRRAEGDVLLLERLAVDFDLRPEQLATTVWSLSSRWPTAEVLQGVLDGLSAEAQRYIISKAHLAIRRKDIRDQAVIDLVKSARIKRRPQPPKGDQPATMSRRFFGRWRRR